MNVFSKWIASTIIMLYGIHGFGQQELEIIKRAKLGNPKLSLDSFAGDKKALEILRNNLYYTDWFELTDSGEIDYFLSGSLRDVSGSAVIGIEVKNPNGAAVTRFELKAPSGTPLKTLINNAVDEMISHIFRVPGFSSSKLAFVKEFNGIKEIWIADFDGANPTQLTHDNNISVEPDWSRENKYLLYTFYDNASTDIILIDMVNSKRKRLTRFPGMNSSAAFSNSSTQVAMTLSKDRNVDLYVLDLPSSKLRRITATEGVEASPCWSPDNSQICYVSDDGGPRPSLYLVSSTGGVPRRLLKLPVEAVSPDWSPVSNKICFSMRSKGQYTIATVDMNSGTPEPEILISQHGDWESPSWAADGRHIVCSRTNNNEKALFLVDSYYGKIIPLKNHTGNDTLPSYSDAMN